MTPRLEPTWDCFNFFKQRGFNVIAGLDEVGRGSIAGPVVVAAVVFINTCCLTGVADSKLLSPCQRSLLTKVISSNANEIAFGQAEPDEIDQLNILNATRLAAKRCIENLALMPDLVLCDGNQKLVFEPASTEIIKGDASCLPIACASIVAKVYRDELMSQLAIRYPAYNLEKNKGYGTRLHFAALEQYGESAIHRKTFIKKSKNNECKLL